MSTVINPTSESKIIIDDANALATFKRIMAEIDTNCKFSYGNRVCTSIVKDGESYCDYHSEGNQRRHDGVCIFSKQKIFICDNPSTGDKFRPYCAEHTTGPGIRKRLGPKASKRRVRARNETSKGDFLNETSEDFPNETSEDFPNETSNDDFLNTMVMFNKRLDAQWKFIERQNETIDVLRNHIAMLQRLEKK